MYVRLKDKPYYFLTDRETHQTYLITQHNQKREKHVYIPEEFETMGPKQKEKHMAKLRNRFLTWSLMNSDKMTHSDKSIANSIISKYIGMGVLFLILTRVFRRAFFRMELPFFEYRLQMWNLNVKWVKSVMVYSTMGVFGYFKFKEIGNLQYLSDLALQYRSNFDNSLHCAQCDPILEPLLQKRFGEKATQALPQ